MKINTLISKQTTLLLILAISFATLFLPLTSLQAATLSDGMEASYVIGAGSDTQDFTSVASGTTNALFANANVRGLAYDVPNSRLFVADGVNHRVLVFNANGLTGLPVDYVADNVLGQADFTSGSQNRGGSAAANTLYNPTGLSYDPTGNRLFVSDASNQRVLVYDTASISDGEAAVGVLGQADFTSTSANRGGSTASTTINSPDSLAFDDTNDKLFLSDKSNHRVLIYNVASITDGEGAVNVLGQADFTSSSINRGGSAASTTMANPGGLEWDSANNRLYLGESSNFAASNARVLIFDLSTTTDGEGAVNVLGQPDFTSTTPANDQDSLGSIIGDVQLDATNNRLFVTDVIYARIMVFDVETITDGENAVNVLGQVNFTDAAANKGGSPAADTLSGPGYMAYVTRDDLLYTTDGQNNRILIFDLSATVSSSSEDTGRGYIHPPLCEATITPSTITAGETATLSWNTTWPTENQNTYYAKVPGEGLYSSRVNSIAIQPKHSTNYVMTLFNLWGANFCEATVEVLDTEGEEVTSERNSILTAGVSNSPIVKALMGFLSKLFTK
ncbi:MAG: hypothetical protein ACI88L_000527 [Candidatus Paceibacteria bacterium]|jgi:hypothetical protein